MGTPDFAVPSLKMLIEKHDVQLVITQTDKPKGRGKKVLFSPVKETAIENNIKVLQPLKIKDESFINELKQIEADIFIVVAYGQILPETVLNIPKYGCINVHGSLLPKYRGAGPIQWAIINGEDITGITIMYMSKGLDTGDMILKKELKINPNDTYGSLHDKMSILGADTLLEAVDMIQHKKVEAVKQDDSLSTYAPMLKKELGHIDWSKTSMQIINLIRGLNPWPSAYSFYDENMIKIWKAEEIEGYSNGINGEILEIIDKKGVIVKTSDSVILVTEIQAQGGKKMPVSDYLRGHKIEKGKILL